MADEVEVEFRAYRWPRELFSYWIALLAIFSIIVLAIYAQFTAVQNALARPQPWYFQMSLAVSIITIIFIILTLFLFKIRMVTPFFMLAFAVIGFVLWLVAIIGSSLALFSNQNNAANDYCHDTGILWAPPQTVVTTSGGDGYYPTTTTTTTVLVYTAQSQLSTFLWHQLCGAWKAAFAFQLFALLEFLYMIYLSFDVLQADKADVADILDVEG
ncbi:hypothetical protein ABW19_dt0205819 [Dactylella cylindrospora]|nr:hypothetical protein ABW19_dt0205819 [Dactylella cylindrospora]